MFSTPTQRGTPRRAKQTPGATPSRTRTPRTGTPARDYAPGQRNIEPATGGLFDVSTTSIQSAGGASATGLQQPKRRVARRSRTPFDQVGNASRARSVSRGMTPGSDRGDTPGPVGNTSIGSKAYLQAQAAVSESTSITLQPGTVLVRDAFHAVTAYSKLPTEVAELLEESDLHSKTCFGSLDIGLGLAYLATATECYVWNFLAAASGAGTPTCYILDNPVPNEQSGSASRVVGGASDLPFLYTFVPWNTGQRVAEPGLLVVDKRFGDIYFAESVTAGTGYTQTSAPQKIPLGYIEVVTVAHRMTNNTIILATSSGRLFRVRIVSSGGRVQIQATPFASSRSFLGRLFGGGQGGADGSAASGSSSTVQDNIISLCSRPLSAANGRPTDIGSTASGASLDGRHEIIAVGKKSIQRWQVQDAGASNEKCLASQDIRQLVTAKAFERGNAQQNASDADPTGARRGLEILDATYLNDGSVALLYSHFLLASEEKELGIITIDTLSDRSKSKAVTAKAGADGGPFFAKRNYCIDGFREEPDARPFSAPRLAAPFGGPMAYIILPNTVVAKLLIQEPDSLEGEDVPLDDETATFQETISLKEDRFSNRFLGFGSESVDVTSEAPVAPLPLLTAKSGALLVEVDWSQATELSQLQQSGDAATEKQLRVERIKSKLESAVFFGDIPYNVLEFPLPRRSVLENGELAEASLALSAEIANSTSTYLPGILDTRAQLADRLHRQVRLIQIIGDSGLSDTLPKVTRDTLCAEAQLVAAGQEIWLENSAHAASSPGETQVMVQVFEAVMQEAGYGSVSEDLVRAFFKHHLYLITQVFGMLVKHLKSGNFKEASLQSKTLQLLQINRIIVPAYHAASEYTEEHGKAYGADKTFAGSITLDAWTCKAVSLEMLETAFHATDALLKERSRELGSAIDMEAQSFVSEGSVEQRHQRELKAHLCELAHFTLATHEQRLSYLSLEESYASERQILAARFKNIRPQVIHPVQRIGNSDQAFSLAERHRDFRTLAELCTDDRAGSEVSLTQHYLTRYGQEFAFELYAHYIEHGRYRKLLEQEEKNVGYLTAYLAANPSCDKVAWLHEIGRGEFKDASGTLAHVSITEELVDSKKLELSLAKLAYVADLSEEAISTQAEQLNIEEIDNQIDIVNVQEQLLANASRIADDTPNPSTEERKAAGYVEFAAQRLRQYPAFEDLLKELVKKMIAKKVLSLEELVDVLTLKDNEGAELVDREGVTDFVTAFETFVRGKEALPESRAIALLQAFWRRVILHTMWDEFENTSGRTDEQIKEELRDTALYYVLTNVDPEDLNPSTLLPTEALLEPPSLEVLQGRFSKQHSSNGDSKTRSAGKDGTIPDQQLNLLLADHETEIDQVRKVLEADLGKWIEEVRRIASEDVLLLRQEPSAAGQEDVVVADANGNEAKMQDS